MQLSGACGTRPLRPRRHTTVEALRRRRPEALEDLLAVYGRELQATAYLILRDRADAEDVVVETLLTAYEKAGSIRDDSALRACHTSSRRTTRS